MQLTELRKQKGKKALYSVFIDGTFVCSLDEFSIYKHKLSVGQEVDKDYIEDIQTESMQSIAFDLCLDLLSKMLKTEHQLREYLHNKGCLPKVVNNVVDKLKEYHYINDEYYAQSFVNAKMHSCGKYKLKNELKQKGIADSIIDSALMTLDNQEEVVHSIALKYMKNKENTRENYAKLARHLASKGFEWEQINSTINKIKVQEGDDEDWQ
ncbi:MAG: RecX family transcriptional regulator [Clostridia bacterium]|nr:RecX family transcriptional regulator [Clostridia bacterium]